MSKKKATAKARNKGVVVATVKSVYVSNKPFDYSSAMHDTWSLGGASEEFTRPEFSGALKRASRKVSEPASKRNET